MRIVSIDPGYERTGFAVFETKQGEEPQLIEFGCITTKKTDSLQIRITQTASQISKLISTFKPKKIILEQLIFNTNVKTAIAVAQAQGAVLYLAAQHGIDTVFLSPPQIKLAVTGYGRADKKQVEKMVCILLNLEKAPTPDDVVDAIACGLAYCATPQSYNMS